MLGKRMNPRIVTLIGTGVFVLMLGHIVLPLAFAKWLMPAEPRYADDLNTAVRAERESKLPPIQLWYEDSPDSNSVWRMKKAARLRLVHGEVFAGEVLVPKEKIPAYLDERVRSGEIAYVIVFPEKNRKWGDVFPVLEQCRRSLVRVVFLNQNEV